MKKNTFIIALMACAVLLVSCGKKKTEVSKPAAAAPVITQAGQKIAFVDIDTLQANYEYFKDCQAALQKKMESSQNTLQSKQLALQKEAASFQQKMQSGQITSEAQAQSLQASLQNKQAELEKLQANLANSYQAEEDKCNLALRDSVNNFIQEYNRVAGYAYILSRSGTNLLYADPACDITADVIKGLNARYKKK